MVKVYTQMEEFVKAIGTSHFHNAQHLVVVALSQADSILNRQSNSSDYNKLLLLQQRANNLFLTLTALSHNQHQREMETCIKQLGEIKRAILRNTKTNVVLNQENNRQHISPNIHKELVVMIDIINNKSLSLSLLTPMQEQSVWHTLLSGFNRHSLVLPNAILYGVTVCIAALISYTIGMERPYWVPVSCAAVMLGANTTFTIHRAIQRSLGTLVGTIIGGIILTFAPSGIALFFLIGILQFFVENVIVRNYVYANMFIAPLVLIIVETLNPGNSISYFVSARALDTVIGSIIGVVGVLILWRDLSHRYVPKSLGKTLYNMSELINEMNGKNRKVAKDVEQKVVTNLINLRTVYDRTLGDFYRKQTNADFYWPAIMHTQHLGYLFITCSRGKHSLGITDKEFENLSELLQLMARKVTENNSSVIVPPTEQITSEEINTDLNELQRAIMLHK
ncbi:FUSC family protein [Virgibacillus phasianinus]|uniref:FUSC family protein n=1 Tax=Virgibacillus phasianinus TaxID=2017483 RepID=UPI0015608A57|nr:FUSC family protein [Virgibacillus phasianinus]